MRAAKLSTSFFRRQGGDDYLEAFCCSGRRAACDNLVAVPGLLLRSRLATGRVRPEADTAASTALALWRRAIRQCGSHRPDRAERLQFRGKGINDFFEAGVAAKRVVPRHQFQAAVAEETRSLCGLREILQGEIFFTDPCVDNGRIMQHG